MEQTSFDSVKHYIVGFLRWMLLALVIGAVCGPVGAFFRLAVTFAAGTFAAHKWLIWLLPAAGVLIVALYRFAKQSASLGTDVLFDAVQERKSVPVLLAPLILAATFITHLFGGSAGREGAALQLGGGIADSIARVLKLNENDRRTIVLVGMGAMFSALFGTPLTATVFVMELMCVGTMNYAALLPCLFANLTAYGIPVLLGMAPESYAEHLSVIPALSYVTVLQVAGLGVLCALLSILFCNVMHVVGHAAKKQIPNEYVRAVIGGFILIGLSYLFGLGHFNGAGGHYIEEAIRGEAGTFDFLLKLLFTAVTLGCGYKGGEIVPGFFVGATFGCVVGPLLGMDAGFAAAICLIALFCANTNCPVAAIILSIELFDGKATLLFAAACAISWVLSGPHSLYGKQRRTHGGVKCMEQTNVGIVD